MKRLLWCLWISGVVLMCGANMATAQTDSLYPYIRYDLNRIVVPSDSGGLSAFWQLYHQMVTGSEGNVQVVHVGGSHIQADIYPDLLRDSLRNHPLAPGSRGFVFPYSAIKSNNPVSFKTRYTGTWTGQRSAVYSHQARWGVNGVTASTSDTVASLTFICKDKEYIESVWVMAALNGYNLDTALMPPLLAIDTTAEGYLLLFYETLQDSVYLAFRKSDSSAVLHLYGCVLNSGKPGLTYHSLGGNGSSFRAFERCVDWQTQLAYLLPNLFIVSIGTNDTSDPDFDSLAFRQRYAAFLDNTLQVNPRCALLLTVPNDSYIRKKYHNNNLEACRNIIYELAATYGAAVWDFYGIMGGAYSAKTWRADQLMKSDLIHFTEAGYLLKGQLLYRALQQDYLLWQQQQHINQDQ